MDERSTLTEARDRPGAAAPDVGAALLGRDEELARLVATLRGDRWIVVAGEAGIGKSSLIRAAHAASGRRAHEGGAFATLDFVPYLAIRRAVGDAVRGDPANVAAIVEQLVGPDLLVLDDLQWADSATISALEFLAGRIQVLAAIREGDPGSEMALRALERGGAEVIVLGGLAEESAATLVRQVRGDLDRDATARMIRQAGGNPLLLEEMARAGETVGVLGRILEGRRSRLSPGARRSLDLLAIAERPLPAWALEDEADLVRSGLVLRHGGDLDIRHALLAAGIRAGLEPSDIAGLHGRVAALVDLPAEQARHLIAAGRAADAETLIRGALPAATGARDRAVLLMALADSTGRLEDRVEAATELVALSDYHAILSLIDAPPVGNSIVELEAGWHRANALARVGRADEAWDLANATFNSATDRTTSVAVRAAMLVALLLINQRGDPEKSARFLDEQLAGFAGDEHERLALAYLRETVRMFTGEVPDVDIMVRAVEESFRDRRADIAARATNLHKVIRVIRGARPALEFAVDMGTRVAAIGYESPAMELYAEGAGAAVFGGSFRRAIELAGEILDRPASFRARLYAILWRAEALTYLGRFELAAASLRLAEALPVDHSEAAESLIAGIELAYWSGSPGRVISIADELVGHGSATDVNMVLPLRTAAWADLDLGRPIRDVPTFALPALAGLGPEMTGLRALAADNLASAVAAFDTAAIRWMGFFEPNAVHCRWAAGEAVRLSGAAAEAVERLREAEGAALEMEFVPLVSKIRRSLRLAGVRVVSPRDARPGAIGLSAREAQVARLVGDGLSNVEIARRLGLGRPTVARMVSSAMAKVGVERRTQLAGRELV